MTTKPPSLMKGSTPLTCRSSPPTPCPPPPGFFCILSILLFGVFKDTETQQPFQFGIAVVGVVGCIILFMLASVVVFYSTRRRKLRPVRRPKVVDSTPEVAPLAAGDPSVVL
jgi:hypothetical protein